MISFRKLFFLLSISLILVYGCDSADDAEYINVAIDVSFRDDEGNDLLNPELEGAYDTSQIKLYYVVDGLAIEQNEEENPNNDIPKNYYYREAGISNYIGIVIFVSDGVFDSESISYLELSHQDTDTIRAHFKEGNLVIDKVWYNEQLVWEATNTNPTAYFSIVK